MAYNLVLILVTIVLSSCATYQSKVASAKSNLQSKDCPAALESLEKLSMPAGVDQLALLMEYGTALQICGQYDKSNQILEQAENLASKVDYTSVTEVASATLTNEGTMTYKGDTFEKLFLNASKALNYLQIKKSDEALVEVRRMNQKFIKYKNEERKSYELNSFSKYLSGLIWESTGQYDDACIDYKDAYFTAQQFRSVGQQMLTTCWTADRVDEFNTLAKKMSASKDEIAAAKNSKSNSEIVFIFLQGWGPQKLARSGLSLAAPGESPLPQLINVSNRTQTLKIDVNGIGQFTSAPIYNVGDAARSSLAADHASLIARRIGARVAKEIVADQIRQKDQLAGFVAWAVMVGSERPDLRQWSFLPNSIQIIRVPVRPGLYKIKISGLGYDNTASENFDDVEISVDRKQKAIHMIRSLL